MTSSRSPIQTTLDNDPSLLIPSNNCSSNSNSSNSTAGLLQQLDLCLKLNQDEPERTFELLTKLQSLTESSKTKISSLSLSSSSPSSSSSSHCSSSHRSSLSSSSSADSFLLSRNSFLDTPLHIACRYGAPQSVVARLIEIEPRAVLCQNLNHNTPLHLACQAAKATNHPDGGEDATIALLWEAAVRLVQEQQRQKHEQQRHGQCPTDNLDDGKTKEGYCNNNGGDDIDIDDIAESMVCCQNQTHGNTPLHEALIMRHTITNSNNNNTSSNNNNSNDCSGPSMMIARRMVEEMLQSHNPSLLRRVLQLSNSQGNTPLHLAMRNHLECPYNENGRVIIRLMVEHYPQAMLEQNAKGQTPLHIALAMATTTATATTAAASTATIMTRCHYHHKYNMSYIPDLSILSCMIQTEGGSKALSIQDKHGHTPLHLACGNDRLAKQSQSQNKTNQQNQKKHTHTSSSSSSSAPYYFSLLELLIQLCPQALQVPSKEGDLPIHLYCRNCSTHNGSMGAATGGLRILHELLISRCPSSLAHSTPRRGTALHILCAMHDSAALHLSVAREWPVACLILDALQQLPLDYHMREHYQKQQQQQTPQPSQPAATTTTTAAARRHSNLSVASDGTTETSDHDYDSDTSRQQQQSARRRLQRHDREAADAAGQQDEDSGHTNGNSNSNSSIFSLSTSSSTRSLRSSRRHRLRRQGTGLGGGGGSARSIGGEGALHRQERLQEMLQFTREAACALIETLVILPRQQQQYEQQLLRNNGPKTQIDNDGSGRCCLTTRKMSSPISKSLEDHLVEAINELLSQLKNDPLEDSSSDVSLLSFGRNCNCDDESNGNSNSDNYGGSGNDQKDAKNTTMTFRFLHETFQPHMNTEFLHTLLANDELQALLSSSSTPTTTTTTRTMESLQNETYHSENFEPSHHDSDYPGLIAAIVRMNEAGRKYIYEDYGNKQKGLAVLHSVNDSLDGLFLHLRECPFLCCLSSSKDDQERPHLRPTTTLRALVAPHYSSSRRIHTVSAAAACPLKSSFAKTSSVSSSLSTSSSSSTTNKHSSKCPVTDTSGATGTSNNNSSSSSSNNNSTSPQHNKISLSRHFARDSFRFSRPL